ARHDLRLRREGAARARHALPAHRHPRLDRGPRHPVVVRDDLAALADHREADPRRRDRCEGIVAVGGRQGDRRALMLTIYIVSLLICLLLGAPLYMLIGGSAVLCFVLFSGKGFVGLASPVVEQIRSLADQQTLLAIPFFMLSGAIMGAGDISKRLIRWARALVG